MVTLYHDSSKCSGHVILFDHQAPESFPVIFRFERKKREIQERIQELDGQNGKLQITSLFLGSIAARE